MTTGYHVVMWGMQPYSSESSIDWLEVSPGRAEERRSQGVRAQDTSSEQIGASVNFPASEREGCVAQKAVRLVRA
jgi:hypothetical protein